MKTVNVVPMCGMILLQKCEVLHLSNDFESGLECHFVVCIVQSTCEMLVVQCSWMYNDLSGMVVM